MPGAPKPSVVRSGVLQVDVGGEQVKQFVELTNSELRYFDEKEKSAFFFKEKERKCNGSIAVDYHAAVQSSREEPCMFSVIRDGIAHKFKASTVADKEDWIEVIDEVINEEEVDARLSGGGTWRDSASTPTKPLKPAVPIMTPSTRTTYKSYYKGYLEISDSPRGKWKEFWAILSMEEFSYYSSHNSTTKVSDLKGSVPISEQTEIHMEDDDVFNTSRRNDFLFSLKTQNKKLFLAAPSEEIRLKWMNTVHSVKKMSLCRAEGDLGTMWKWESHLKDTMCDEDMPTDPKMKIRSASIFGFRPRGSDSDDEKKDNKKEGLIPTGLSSLFEGLDEGRQKFQSTLSEGIDSFDNGRQLMQRSVMDGAGSFLDKIDAGCSSIVPSFGSEELEDFETMSDSFDEYMDDDSDESNSKQKKNDFFSFDGKGKGLFSDKKDVPKAKRVTIELTSKLTAIGIASGSVAVFLLLFIFHSIIFDLGYFILLLECVIVGTLFFISYQQILGYLVGAALRYKMTGAVNGDGCKFNIHLEALKLQLGMDLCEVEVRNLLWYNPDKFKGSYGECMLKIRAIRITVPTLSLFRVIVDKKRVLKINQIYLDTVLITVAQAGHGANKEFNVTSAVGHSDSRDEAPPASPEQDLKQEESSDKNRPPPYRFDLRSFIMIEFKARLRNVFKVKSTNLRIPYICMQRQALTGISESNRRLPLSPADLITAIIREIGSEMVAENKVAMLTILSTSGARHLISFFNPKRFFR